MEEINATSLIPTGVKNTTILYTSDYWEKAMAVIPSLLLGYVLAIVWNMLESEQMNVQFGEYDESHIYTSAERRKYILPVILVLRLICVCWRHDPRILK